MNLRELADRAVELDKRLADLLVPALQESGLIPGEHRPSDVPESHPSFNEIQEILAERRENARLRGVGSPVAAKGGADISNKKGNDDV